MENTVKKNIVICCLDYNIGLEVAKKLAERLDMYFLDIQGLYEFDIKPRTIAETIRDYGVDYYRKEMAGSIKYVSTFDNSIIAIESGAVEDAKNIERLKKYCLFVYVRSFPRWVSNSDYQFQTKSKEEEDLYKLSAENIVKRDNILCEKSDIISYGSDKESDSFINDIVEKIKDFYGVKQ